MDRQALLLNLAHGLIQAAAEGRWEILAEVDRRVAADLRQLAALGAWTSGERAAFEALQRAHHDAREDCARAIGQLQERMEEMRANHAGWCAYAESGDLEENGA